MLQPYELGLILSYKCQSECAHCLYCCGPAWQDWMESEEVRRAFEATRMWEHPYRIHITGGEPFLNFPLLKHAIEVAYDLGIPCYVETNAGWCTQYERGLSKFDELRQEGLRMVLISCSPFHAQSIPPQRTLMAIRAAQATFGANNVVIYLANFLDVICRFGTENTTHIDELVDILGKEVTGNLLWEGYGLISGGRSAYRLGHLRRKYPPSVFEYEDCRGEILFPHHSHFDLYGNYISGFCGGLSIGDWHDLAGLQRSFEYGEMPQLISMLVDSGPHALYKYARDVYGYERNSAGYVGKCHLCVDVRRTLVQSGDFAELQPVEFYQRI